MVIDPWPGVRSGGQWMVIDPWPGVRSGGHLPWNAEKKEIKPEMADEDKKDEAEFEEIDDAKINKVVLRQKSNCKYKNCIGQICICSTGMRQ